MASWRWTPRRALGLLVLCNLLWAGSYVAGKEALRLLSPIELNCLRFTIAGLILLPLIWRDRARVKLKRRDLPRLVLLCLCGFVVNKAIEFTGLSLTGASDTALLIASESIFTAVLAWLVLHETIRRGSLGGLFIGCIGVYIVVEGGLTLPHLGGTRLLGDLFVVLALIPESFYTILGKAQLDRYPGLFLTAACILGSLVAWVPATVLNVAHSGLPHMNGTAWSGVLYLAVAATVIGYVGWMVALRHVDAASAGVTLFIQPLGGAILAILILGERPSWATLIGGACIVGGVALASQAHTIPESVMAASAP